MQANTCASSVSWCTARWQHAARRLFDDVMMLPAHEPTIILFPCRIFMHLFGAVYEGRCSEKSVPGTSVGFGATLAVLLHVSPGSKQWTPQETTAQTMPSSSVPI